MPSSSTPILPAGFRFHPTDQELIVHYLMNQAASLPCPVTIIAEVDIYKFDPWELPSKAMFGEKEWYFFSPRDRKYPNGVRPNRSAGSGYWKATGTDKPIMASAGINQNIGVKKALVFYTGKPPKGVKSDWIMHEYRLSESKSSNSNKNVTLRGSMRLDDWVLCRIYKKRSNHQYNDQEQEESAVEDSFVQSPPKPSPFNLTKAYSLTDLLNDMDCSAFSQLLDSSSDLPELSHIPVSQTSSYQPVNYTSINNSMSQDCFVSMPENGLKRKRPVFDSSFEDGTEFSHSAKKPTDSRSFSTTNYCNQFDSFQFSLPNQPFLLFNSHLEMQ